MKTAARSDLQGQSLIVLYMASESFCLGFGGDQAAGTGNQKISCRRM